MKILRNGLLTGLFLQLAVGPVFFFIVNLALQKTFFDGLVGVLAVTLVDYFYIMMSILGLSEFLEHKKIKKIFGTISSIVLIVFGVLMIKKSASLSVSAALSSQSTTLLSSFVSVFLVTISNPMTIVFFTSVFMAKAVEYNYTKKELFIFGVGTGMASFLFMGSAVIFFSLLKASIPLLFIHVLNVLVGILLVGYGLVRLVKIGMGWRYERQKS